MAKLKIVKIGDPILRTVCRPVETITPRTLRLLDDMVETMRAADGVGGYRENVSLTSDRVPFYLLFFNVARKHERLVNKLSSDLAVIGKPIKLGQGDIIVSGAARIFLSSARNILNISVDTDLLTAHILGLFDLIPKFKNIIFRSITDPLARGKQTDEHY